MDKKQRVQRMIKLIKGVIIGYFTVSMITIIALVISVFSLKGQIKNLNRELSVATKNTYTFNMNDLYMPEFEESEEITEEIETRIYAEDISFENPENYAADGDIRTVYLTFDDGPSAVTDEILNILDDYGVKATFFVIGREDADSVARYKRIVDEGHTIAMHSYTHKYSELYSSREAFFTDFNNIRNLIYNTTGVDPKFYRFPGGSSNKVSKIPMQDICNYVSASGFTYFDWNVANGDAKGIAYTPDELVENVMKDVVKYKTSVVLMHDAAAKKNTAKSLPKLIESLQDMGCLLLPITEDTPAVQHITAQQ